MMLIFKCRVHINVEVMPSQSNISTFTNFSMLIVMTNMLCTIKNVRFFNRTIITSFTIVRMAIVVYIIGIMWMVVILSTIYRIVSIQTSTTDTQITEYIVPSIIVHYVNTIHQNFF